MISLLSPTQLRGNIAPESSPGGMYFFFFFLDMASK